jgi:hypothetical protein
MRDTSYATEIARASIGFDAANEGRIERIHVKEQGQDEIRFSCWKDGRMTPRPLDLSENDLLTLLQMQSKLIFSRPSLGQDCGTCSEATSTERPSFSACKYRATQARNVAKVRKVTIL